MRERFESRNGYAAAPFLPTLAGYAIDDESTTLGFLYDYRRNIASLWTENYSRLFANRLKPYDMQLAIEPYGNGNFDPFSYAKPAGLIMGEYWVGDSQLNPSVKHAASVAHVYGHSVVGAEALTATPDQAGWRNQPRQWKPFADKAMTTGINRVIYHRFAHQPWVSGVLPGMTMGPWGSHVDRTNTIWPYMPAWNQYLSRCQYLLQQGKFVGDVLLFTGEDSPQSYAGEGQDLPKVPEGYDYDFCGSDPLMSLRVKDHRLLLPNGASYAVLALPNTTAMSLPLARKIKQLVSEGAYVVGPKPTHSPSLSEASGTDELRRLAMDIWGNGLGQGKVYSGQSIGAVLKRLGVAKDFAAASGGVSAIHRRVGNREVFFVASNEPYPRTVACTFRAAGPMKVELWHPDTGLIEQAPVWSAGQGTIQIPLLFDADGSVFVVLSPGVPQSHLTSISVATSATAKPKPPLQIIKAVYGDFPSGKTADVTAILKRAASPFSLRIGATNGNMGGDPASMIVKTLQVTYEQGGVTKTVTVAENQILMIGDVPDAGTQPAYEISTKELVVWQSGLYRLARPHGAAATVAVRDMPPAQAVSGPWNVAFPAGWDAPPQVTFGKLMSWADHPDFAIKHFSGTATYTKELQVPESLLQANQRLMLDLGDVRELCRVRLNGKLLAKLYKPPFRIDITKAAHIGQNELQIEVTNLWVNRLIGDEQFPDDMGWNGAQLSRWPDWFVNHQPRPEPRRKTFTTWRHNTKNTPLMPSGLIGPVVLSPAKIIRLR
ncbi:MAG TPA: glycosyl hydrolase, partial [Fimbriimonas sp.]|nr:glycosyl hydrolase [Fimbriimonas sp.]